MKHLNKNKKTTTEVKDFLNAIDVLKFLKITLNFLRKTSIESIFTSL